MDWMLAAEWFSAVGTVGAFAAAFWSLTLQRRELSEQRLLMEHEQQARRIAQAKGVFTTLGFVERQEGPGSEPRMMPLIKVANSSAEPAYEVVVSAVDMSGALVNMGTVPTLPPGAVSRIPLGDDVPNMPKLGHIPTGFMLTFRDAAGNQWVREPNGRLH
jgi:hypothetical protein